MTVSARRVVLSFLLPFGLFSFSLPASAQTSISQQYSAIQSQGLIFANICSGTYTDPCECRDKGQCSVQDILQFFVNASYLVFALAGTAALIAFVYGGVLFITANGHSDRIERGKKSLTGAIIGLFIIFLSYVTINLVVSILKTGEPATGDLESTLGDSAGDVITTE